MTLSKRFFGPFLDGFMEFEYLELSFKLFLLPFLSISREQSTLPGILKDFYDKIRWKMNTVRSFDPFSLLKIHLIPSLSTRNSWIQIWCYSESAREWTNKLACTFLIFGMKGYNATILNDFPIIFAASNLKIVGPSLFECIPSIRRKFAI